MAEWRDMSVVCGRNTYMLKVGSLVLEVSRHPMLTDKRWSICCRGVLQSQAASTELNEAKAEAVALLRAKLRATLDALPG